MKQLEPAPDWPAAWRLSYTYDRLEVYGDEHDSGYAYAYRNRRDRTLALVCDVLPQGARILDIAAAQGNFSLALAERGFHVTWNDLREELAEYVARKYEFGCIDYAPGNAFELTFTSPFDAVLITEVIEHVAHPDQFLRHAAQLVQPGGYVIMTTPNGGYFRNTLPRFSDCPDPERYEALQFGPNSDNHIFLLHADEVVRLAESAGLQVDTISHFTNSLTNGHLKLAPLLRLMPGTLVNGIERFTQGLPHWLGSRLLVHTAARFRVPRAPV